MARIARESAAAKRKDLLEALEVEEWQKIARIVEKTGHSYSSCRYWLDLFVMQKWAKVRIDVGGLAYRLTLRGKLEREALGNGQGP